MGTPSPGDVEPRGFPKLFQPGSSTSFGCSRYSFTAGGPACIWKLWASAEGNRHAKSMGRAHWLAHPPHLPQPQDTPSKGLKAAQASGMWQQPGSLRPERSRVSILFLYLFLFWCRCDLQCCRVGFLLLLLVCLFVCFRCTAT